MVFLLSSSRPAIHWASVAGGLHWFVNLFAIQSRYSKIPALLIRAPAKQDRNTKRKAIFLDVGTVGLVILNSS